MALPPITSPRFTTRTTVLLAALLLAAAPAAAGPVWKCQENGRTVFSDVPCAGTGREVDPRLLKSNVLPAARPPARPLPGPVPAASPGQPDRTAAEPPAAAPNVCPDARELRDMETRASSITLGAKEKAFLDDEIRRAHQCRKGQGRYSAQDWQISREAQADQSSLSSRQRGRERAEDMHSAADPLEGERIANRRLQEEALRRARQPVPIAHCDPGGCWSTQGRYYPASGPGWIGPQGSLCQRVDGMLQCP